ncbi:MAG TPA: hypothetical protein VGC90_04080 [Candidatus Limnocylindrales bacterium]
MIEERQSIETVASEWLEAERRATAGDNMAGLEDRARALSASYDDAIRSASAEELRLAWEAAQRIQAACEMGSGEWASARQVSELLRAEYLASRGAAETPAAE